MSSGFELFSWLFIHITNLLSVKFALVDRPLTASEGADFLASLNIVFNFFLICYITKIIPLLLFTTGFFFFISELGQLVISFSVSYVSLHVICLCPLLFSRSYVILNTIQFLLDYILRDLKYPLQSYVL